MRGNRRFPPGRIDHRDWVHALAELADHKLLRWEPHTSAIGAMVAYADITEPVWTSAKAADCHAFLLTRVRRRRNMSAHCLQMSLGNSPFRRKVTRNSFAASIDRLRRPSLCGGYKPMKRKLVEATITQSDALYLAQCRNMKDRRRYFQHMRSAALNQPAVVRTLRTLKHWPLRHSDIGK